MNGQTSPEDTGSPEEDTTPDLADTANNDDVSPDTPQAEGLCDRIELGANGDLRGLNLFPEDNYWNQTVVDDEVDPNSDAIIASIGSGTGLHPDFGCCYPDSPFGIPYVVVDSETQGVPITFLYADESEPGPYPIPADAPIEGGPDADGDRHILVLDCSSETLYEVFNAYPEGEGWRGDSGAVWDLNQEPIRAPYCTSADAAGLPILPGLVRYDEVERGEITHALRFTVARTRRAFVRPPASHWASSSDDPNLPPMGMRVRLKNDAALAADGIDVASLHPQVQVIVRALQTYGMILADNGSDWYISGMPHAQWSDEHLVSQFRQIQGRHFEVLKMDGLVDSYDLAPGECQLP